MKWSKAMSIGKSKQEDGQYTQAIRYFNKALVIARSNGSKEEQANTLELLAFLFMSIEKYPEAVDYYENGLIIAQDIDDKKLECKMCHGLGILKQKQDQHEEAIRYLNKALVIAGRHGLKEEEADTLYLLADLYHLIEKYHEAADYYRKGLPISQDIGDKELECKMCHGLGHAYDKLGQFNDNMKYTKQGLDIALRTGDSKLIANSYHNLGNSYQLLCEYQISIKCYNKSINMYKKQGDEKGLGACYGDLSNTYLDQGKYHDALYFQEESLRINNKIGDKKGKATSLLNVGTIHQTLNNHEKANDFYQQSLTIAKEINHIGLQGKCYGNLGGVLSDCGHFQDAISYDLQRLKIAMQLGDKQEQGDANLNIGTCYKQMNLYHKANEYFKRSLIITKELKGKETEALVYYNMASMHCDFGEFQQAISMLEECLDISVSIGNKHNEGGAFYLLGRIYHSLTKDNHEHETHVSYMAKSEEYLKKALDCYDYLFSQLHHRDKFKISIFDKFMKTYKLLTTVYIETQQQQEALLVSDRERARALGDRLIFKYGMSQEEYLSSEPLTYPDIEILLSNDAFTLLHYSLLEQSLAVWVLSKDSITFKETDKQQFVTAVETLFGEKKKEKETTINRFFTDTVARAYEDMKIKDGVTCENRSLDDSMTPKDQQRDGVSESLSRDGTTVNEPGQESHPLEVLYNALIAPVMSHVKHDEVVIVPDGKMYTVPFAALKDPNTGQYLSETKRIRLAPSITILKVLQECPVDHHSQQGALIVGNPSVGEVMFRGNKTTFSDLHSAQIEVQRITKLLTQASRTANPNITTLTGKQASKDVVLTKLREGVAIIHIAAHGSSEYGEILLAPIVSSDSSGLPKEHDYLLTMTEVVGIKAQLVVLSCCYSGLGEIRPEGMVGLSRAFLAAGARAVVASLWAIDDDVTLSFMNSFYESLCKGDSASVSLDKAMKYVKKLLQRTKVLGSFLSYW